MHGRKTDRCLELIALQLLVFLRERETERLRQLLPIENRNETSRNFCLRIYSSSVIKSTANVLDRYIRIRNTFLLLDKDRSRETFQLQQVSIYYSIFSKYKHLFLN